MQTHVSMSLGAACGPVQSQPTGLNLRQLSTLSFPSELPTSGSPSIEPDCKREPSGDVEQGRKRTPDIKCKVGPPSS